MPDAPTTRSREQVTVAAASRGLGLFDDSWSIGLWTFSTKLVGNAGLRGSWSRSGRCPASGASWRRRSPRSRPPAATPASTTPCWPRTRRCRRTGSPAGSTRSCCSPTARTRTTNGISASSSCSASSSRSPTRSGPVQVIIIGIGSEVSKTELESITKVDRRWRLRHRGPEQDRRHLPHRPSRCRPPGAALTHGTVTRACVPPSGIGGPWSAGRILQPSMAAGLKKSDGNTSEAIGSHNCGGRMSECPGIVGPPAV